MLGWSPERAQQPAWSVSSGKWGGGEDVWMNGGFSPLMMQKVLGEICMDGDRKDAVMDEYGRVKEDKWVCACVFKWVCQWVDEWPDG